MNINQTMVNSNAAFKPGDDLPNDLDISSIKAWLTQLPMANTTKSSRMILSFIQLVNESELEAVRRFEILECLRPALIVLLPSLDAQFIDRGIPLSDRSKTFAKLCLDCRLSIATGYRLISDTPQFSENQEFNPTMQSTVLYRFLHTQCMLLIRASNLYEETSRDFWSEIYQVFSLAQSMALENESIEDIDSESEGEITISIVFKTIVLFSLINPFKYQQRSHYQIYRLILQFAQFCTLHNKAIVDGRKALFLVDLKTEKAPGQVQYATLETVQKPLFIYTRGMAEAIVSEIQTIASGDKSDLSSQLPRLSFVHNVIRMLGAPPRRKAIRVAEDQQMQMSIGMSNIAKAFVNQDSEKSTKTPDKSISNAKQTKSNLNNTHLYGLARSNNTESSQPTENSLQYNLIPIENDFGFINDSSRKNNVSVRNNDARNNSSVINWFANESQLQTSSDNIWNNPAGSSSGYDTEQGRSENQNVIGQLVDSSITGYQLMWPKPCAIKLKITELIGLEAENNRLELGVVRWIRNGIDKLCIGLELLSHEAKVVAIIGQGNSAQHNHAFVFLDRFEKNSTTSIVLQSHKYKPGDHIDLLVAKSRVKYRLEALKESTETYRYFNLAKTRD